MEQRIRRGFTQLYERCRSGNADDHYALIAYLQSLLTKAEVRQFEDVGFCYWNLSDQYALLRDGHNQVQNHQRFYEHIQKGCSSYQFWLVCDATQRLTLEKDGYGDLWWSYYRDAVRTNGIKGLPAEFAAHKAALYKNPSVEQDKKCFAFAKSSFEEFLAYTKGQNEYDFYYAVYLSLIAQYETVDESTLCTVGLELLAGLSVDKSEKTFLIGEWGKFMTPLDDRRRAEIGLNSVINSLINTHHLSNAKRLYAEAVAAGMLRNNYIESRL